MCVCRLWATAELQCEEELCSLLVEDVVHEQSAVRQAAAEGLASAIKQHPEQIDTILQLLLNVYSEQLYVSHILNVYSELLYVSHILNVYSEQLYVSHILNVYSEQLYVSRLLNVYSEQVFVNHLLNFYSEQGFVSHLLYRLLRVALCESHTQQCRPNKKKYINPTYPECFI